MFKDGSHSQEEKVTQEIVTGLSELEKLKGNFAGTVILPEDNNYEQLSETISGKGNPAIIVQPMDSVDIVSAIHYAKKKSLIISIRSGGHGSAGFATNNGGMVIDLSNFNKVEVLDKLNGKVRVGAGAKWGDVAKQLEAHNLAITSGDTKSVGVGGLTLGGGIGWMVRKFGLTIDNLVAADVVTADGIILHINAEENKDLFWAIRGGGGNFCVVTNFEFIARPLSKVVFGSVQYNLDELPKVLKGWRENMNAANENLNSTIRIMPSLFGNPPAVIVLLCYTGNLNPESKKAIKPFLHLGKVIQKDIKEMNYADVLEEAMHPPAVVKVIIKNILTDNFSDELIQKIIDISGNADNTVLQIRNIEGAINKIPSDDTAFAFRNSKVIIAAGIIVPASSSESEIEVAMRPWNSLKEFSIGSYVCFTSGEDNIKNIYPEATYNRLSQIKQEYDPQNIFNQNFNIKPIEIN